MLWLAAQIASTCAAAYRSASEKTRSLFNNAVFGAVLARDGKVADALYCWPFDVLFVRSGSNTEIWLASQDLNQCLGGANAALLYMAPVLQLMRYSPVDS